jgi:hypothetical protein
MKNQIIFIALSTFAADDKKPLQLLEASGFPYKIHQSGKRITPEELMLQLLWQEWSLMI